MKHDLNELAFKASYPFCYSCYQRAETGRCKKCGSDDLMRELPGVGVEYGIDWIINHFAESCEAIDLEEYTENLLNDVYSEDVVICGMNFGGHGTMLKMLDPVAFRCSVADLSSDFIDSDDYHETKNGDFINVSDLVDALENAEIMAVAS